MNYGLAEQEIVDRLNEQFQLNNVQNLYEAAVIPDTEKEFKEFYTKFNKARIAVEFIDLLPQPSSSVNKLVQENTVRFRLTFEARKMRGPGGLFALFELTELILIGYKLKDALNRLSLVKYGMVEYSQDSKQPYYEFECKSMHAQAFNDFSDDTPFSNNPIKIQFPPETIA